jgi:hypothetical protein
LLGTVWERHPGPDILQEKGNIGLVSYSDLSQDKQLVVRLGGPCHSGVGPPTVDDGMHRIEINLQNLPGGYRGSLGQVNIQPKGNGYRYGGDYQVLQGAFEWVWRIDLRQIGPRSNVFGSRSSVGDFRDFSGFTH